jgi:hypothetical protein
VVAVVAAVSAGIAVAAIFLLGSNTPLKHDYNAAPAQCVQAWNQNELALYVGRHEYGYHRYKQVEVLTLSLDGRELPMGSPGGYCAIVFANNSLDPEFAAAAVIKKPTGWFALSRSASPNRLANCSPGEDGIQRELQPDSTVTAIPPPELSRLPDQRSETASARRSRSPSAGTGVRRTAGTGAARRSSLPSWSGGRKRRRRDAGQRLAELVEALSAAGAGIDRAPASSGAPKGRHGADSGPARSYDTVATAPARSAGSRRAEHLIDAHHGWKVICSATSRGPVEVASVRSADPPSADRVSGGPSASGRRSEDPALQGDLTGHPHCASPGVR